MTVTELKHNYNLFNVWFFDSMLPTISHIDIKFDTSIKEAAGYSMLNKKENDSDKQRYTIALNNDVCKTDEDVLNTLAHEMIHIFQFVFDFDKYTSSNSWNMSHNRVFLAKMNYINQICGDFGVKLNIGTVFNKID